MRCVVTATGFVMCKVKQYQQAKSVQRADFRGPLRSNCCRDCLRMGACLLLIISLLNADRLKRQQSD